MAYYGLFALFPLLLLLATVLGHVLSGDPALREEPRSSAAPGPSPRWEARRPVR